MTEKELFTNLRKLGHIKPRKDWVSSTKSRILGKEPAFSFFQAYLLKPAVAGFAVLVVMVGMFGLVKNSMPGDPLYSVRKLAHWGQSFFIARSDLPVYKLDLANDRLDDLTKAAGRNLAPTISEFQANVSEAAQEIAKMDATTSNPTVIRKIVEGAKKLKENQQKVESLGVVVEGAGEIDNALEKVANNLIEDLKGRTLTQSNEKVLSNMEELFAAGKYSEVLESYLTSQQ
jgi:hypothetical protein